MGLIMAMALIASAPREAEAQGLVEYALILVLAENVAQNSPPIPAGGVLTGIFGARTDDLAAALQSQNLEEADDEARRLLASARALRGVYNACEWEECAVLRSQLDLIIDGLGAILNGSGPSESSPDP
jgi:hypothetical protein